MRSFLASFLLGISMTQIIAPLCADADTTEEVAEEEETSEESSES